MSGFEGKHSIIFDKNMNLLIKSDPVFDTLFGHISTLTELISFLSKNTMLDENFINNLKVDEKEYQVCYKTIDKKDSFEFHFFLLDDSWTIVNPRGRQDIYDQLTNLLTERNLVSLLEHELKCASRDKSVFTTLIIDLAHIQDINEAFGYLAGDAIIKSVADILKKNTRASDSVGRYKGDKYIVILHKTDKDGTLQYIEKLEKALKSVRFTFAGLHFHPKINYGISTCEGERSVDKLLEKLRTELNIAKKTSVTTIEYFQTKE